jgi:UDP-glucose 4-epimerase
MKVLITGGAGNVGGSLARRLVLDPENYVVIVDNISTGSYNKLPDRSHTNWNLIKADVNNFNDISSIICSGAFDYIFHYAAVVGVERTLKNPKLVLNDIDGVRNILDLAKNTGVKRVFFSSSSEVYGEPVEVPQRESTTPLNSRLPYAIVKNVGEAFCRSYQQEYGLDYTIFRFFNTYGPLQSEDFVITKFIGQAMRNKDLTIYGDGSQTRTFCFVEDNIDATVLAITNDMWINDVVNIGSNIEMQIIDLAKLVIKVINSKSSIIHLPPLKEGDMTRRKPDTSKMMEVLGCNLTPLEEGIKLTAQFLKNNY